MRGSDQGCDPGILVIPARADVERDQVASAWAATGGDVTRLARFWEPPRLERSRVRVYGDDTFCLVLAEVLGLVLVSPPDDLLLNLDQPMLGRDVGAVALADAASIEFPRFVKPIVPKQFPAGVYEDWGSLDAVTQGLEPDAVLIQSEPVHFAAEARVFVLDGEVAAAGLYEGAAPLDHVRSCIAAVGDWIALPSTVVLDLGWLDGRWVVIEANATWGAGLNGCDAAAVIACIAAATRPRDTVR
jgi:hypothetical protein